MDQIFQMKIFISTSYYASLLYYLTPDFMHEGVYKEVDFFFFFSSFFFSKVYSLHSKPFRYSEVPGITTDRFAREF